MPWSLFLLFWLPAGFYVLTDRDIPPRVAVTVGDDVEVIAEHVGQLYRADYAPILVCGGMGGTHDDHTREGIAAACGLELTTHAECRAILQKRDEERDLPFTPERQRMAEMPAGATLLFNPEGAPGFSLFGKIFAFPGFPRMLQPMLTSLLDGDASSSGIAPPVPAERQWRSEEVLLATIEGAIAGCVEQSHLGKPSAVLLTLPAFRTLPCPRCGRTSVCLVNGGLRLSQANTQERSQNG